MEFYVNDASLIDHIHDGNFEKIADVLVELAKLRTALPKESMLEITYSLTQQKHQDNTTLISKFYGFRDREKKKLILAWFNTAQSNSIDVSGKQFFFLNNDVTNTALGHICHHIPTDKIIAKLYRTFSFESGNQDYLIKLIDVESKRDNPTRKISIKNDWTLEEIKKVACNQIELDSWPQLLEYARIMYPNLLIQEETLKHPKSRGMQSNKSIIKAMSDRLEVLDSYVSDYLVQGKEGEKGKKLREENFPGYITSRNWFSDEVKEDKAKFEDDLTFKNYKGESIFATWHGKVNIEEPFRCYFKWPFTNHKLSKLEILYIGPKITIG